MVSTGSAFAVRVGPNPTGSVISGTRNHTGRSPRPHSGRDAGSGGRYTGRSSATRPRGSGSSAATRSAPRSPYGIDGYAASNSRTRGSNASRPTRGAAVLRRPLTSQRRLHRVPRDPQHPRDLRDRHALSPPQPADLSPVLHVQHCFLPGSTQQGSGKLVKSVHGERVALWVMFGLVARVGRSTRPPPCAICAKDGVWLRTGRRSAATVRVGICREPYVLKVCERHLALLEQVLPASGVWTVERYTSA